MLQLVPLTHRPCDEHPNFNATGPAQSTTQVSLLTLPCTVRVTAAYFRCVLLTAYIAFSCYWLGAVITKCHGSGPSNMTVSRQGFGGCHWARHVWVGG